MMGFSPCLPMTSRAWSELQLAFPTPIGFPSALMIRTISSFSNSPLTSVMPTGRILAALSATIISAARGLMCSSPLAKPSLCAIHFLMLETGCGAGTKRVQSVSSGFSIKSVNILFAGYTSFGQHSSTSKARFRGLDVGGQITVLFDFADDF